MKQKTVWKRFCFAYLFVVSVKNYSKLRHIKGEDI